LTARAGLLSIHLLLTQYSKNGFSIAMRRTPVCGLTGQVERNLANVQRFPLVNNYIAALFREFDETRHQQSIFLVCGESGGFGELVKEKLTGIRDGRARR
jgi:alpha-beta hydrolase superfamily lysophospholipase